MDRKKPDRSKKINKRAILFRQCGGKCPICGREMSLKNYRALDSYMTIDHIYPKSLGGCNEMWNLQAMCRKCNMRKSDNIVKKKGNVIDEFFKKRTNDYY